VAYDEAFAERVRAALRGRRGVTEKKMFGGLAFLLRGHMFVGLAGKALMARTGAEGYEAALKRKGVREMDFTGKPMCGYVFVDPKVLKSAADLRYWVDLCADFAGKLPAKKK
jgi:hypothetical protein